MADLLQILHRTGVKARVTLYADGVATDSATQVKVDVVRPDGTLLVTQANATDEAGDGVYGYQLAPQADPTLLRLDWSGTVGGVALTVSTWVEVLGGLLFTLPELRALKVANGFPFALTATPLFTDAQLMDTRAATLEEMTEVLGFSPVPRFVREVHSVDRSGTVILKELLATRVLSVSVAGVAQSAADYAISDGGVLLPVSNYAASPWASYGYGNVAVEYVAGWERVKGIGGHIAMIWTAAQLNPSGFSSATTVTVGDATYTYEPSETGRGGFERHTGIREADRWFRLHSQRGVAVA
jgi:hypothetical protein